jgi:hypothetical protein
MDASRATVCGGAWKLEVSPQRHMRGNAKLSLPFSRVTIADRVLELGGQISRDCMRQGMLL